MTVEPIIGRCAVPGCQGRAVIRRYDDAGADLLCVFHGREELEMVVKFGTLSAQDAARAKLQGQDE